MSNDYDGQMVTPLWCSIDFPYISVNFYPLFLLQPSLGPSTLTPTRPHQTGPHFEPNRRLFGTIFRQNLPKNVKIIKFIVLSNDDLAENSNIYSYFINNRHTESLFRPNKSTKRHSLDRSTAVASDFEIFSRLRVEIFHITIKNQMYMLHMIQAIPYSHFVCLYLIFILI